jgi:hypothetical protein
MGKIVITGTGRCGTSFLMHLFTALGFNTGYTLEECEQHLAQSGCNGGIEHSIGSERFEKADIVKNPEWFYTPELLDFDIDYIIIPFRKLFDVSRSRSRIGHNKYGGFWQGAINGEDQMRVDATAFYKFIEFTTHEDIKIIFLDFKKIVKYPYYLYTKLHDLVDGYEYYDFEQAFNQIADIEKVHI